MITQPVLVVFEAYSYSFGRNGSIGSASLPRTTRGSTFRSFVYVSTNGARSSSYTVYTVFPQRDSAQVLFVCFRTRWDQVKPFWAQRLLFLYFFWLDSNRNFLKDRDIRNSTSSQLTHLTTLRIAMAKSSIHILMDRIGKWSQRKSIPVNGYAINHALDQFTRIYHSLK